MASRADLHEALFFVGVGLLLAAVSSSVVYFAMSAAMRRRELVCGNCGYSVRGLTTFKCPECGADFREVGIERHRATKTPFFVAMSVGLVVAGVVIIVGGWLSL